MKYRSEIDGLRAIAVVAVILYHAGFGVSGGYIGVDIFFVISGYLITSLILKEMRTGSFSLIQFYERRARRILPALFLVLAATFAIGWFVLVPSEMEDLSNSIMAVTAFVSNISFWLRTDYFAPAAELNPLLHTWSLGVEEQFYFFYPLLLLALVRFLPKNIFALVTAVSLASLGLAEWASRAMPVANFYLLPTRAWELGTGCLCALAMADRDIRKNERFALAGLALAVVPLFLLDVSTPFPSLMAVPPVLGTAMLILYAQKGTWVARMLSVPAIVLIGLISYSAYLWHQPLFAFARLSNVTNSPSPAMMVGLIALTVILSLASWHFVEKPFRRRKGEGAFTRNQIFSMSGIAIAAFMALGYSGLATGGYREMWIDRHPGKKETLAVIEAAQHAPVKTLTDGKCRFAVARLDPQVVARIRQCADTFGPGLLVLGDSHSIDIFNGLYMSGKIGPFTFGLIECRLHEQLESCQIPELRRLLADGLYAQMIYAQAGFHLLRDHKGREGRPILSAIPLEGPNQLARYQVKRQSVDEVVKLLSSLSGDVRITWLGPRIEPQIAESALIQRGCAATYDLRPGQRALFRRLDKELSNRAGAAGIRYFSQVDINPLDMKTDYLDCQTWWWRDRDHWSMKGAKRFVGRLVQAGLLDDSTSENGRK